MPASARVPRSGPRAARPGLPPKDLAPRIAPHVAAVLRAAPPARPAESACGASRSRLPGLDQRAHGRAVNRSRATRRRLGREGRA